MAPCALVFHFTGSLGTSTQVQYLFDDAGLAEAARHNAVGAAKAWNDRTNDREKLFTFDHATGSATVDVSNLLAVSVDNPFGDKRAMVEEWNRSIGAMRRMAGEGPVQQADLA